MSKTIEVVGMKKAVCASCFEYPENCKSCEWYNCAICGEELAESETYEYRGVFSCIKDFDELCNKRDEQRQRVMEITDKSVRSQADGEWANGGYKTMKTDTSGCPITKAKEPLMLQEYEKGKL